MSVTRMKLATVIGPLELFDTFIQRCILGKEFQPESASLVMQRIKGLHPFDAHNPYADTLRHAERLIDITGIEPSYTPFDAGELTVDESAQYLAGLDARFSALNAEKAGLNKRLEEDEHIAAQLALLHGIDVPIHELVHVNYTKFRFGRMPRDIYDTFQDLIKTREDIYFFVTDQRRDSVYGMYMTPRVNAEKADALLASLQFERIRLSDRLSGSADEAAAALEQDIIASRKRLADIDIQLHRDAGEERETFLKHYCYLRFMDDVFALRRFAAHTVESFYFLGWLPESDYAAFEQNIGALGDTRFVIIGEDPEGQTDYKPPTKLRNHKFFRPFEPFVQMYGLPSYNETDPTPLMSLTYPLMFGAMFGDIGHGIILLLAGLLMWYGRKMWIGRVLCYCAVCSVGFGFVYGSIFGNEHLLPGFKVLESSATTHFMLEITMYAGAILTGFVILLNIINGFRQKNPEKSFFSANSISGLVLYVGIVFTVLPFLGFGTSPLPMPALIAMIALPVVLVFLREPLSALAEKKKVHLEDGVGGFIMANFFEMFEVLLSFVTNTISFLRIGAYAVSHASMMTVVYTMAQQTDGSHSIGVLIVGNLIVAGIEALLVAIQVLRLEFYEIFGRFYSGGGKPFEPLTINYKRRK